MGAGTRPKPGPDDSQSTVGGKAWYELEPSRSQDPVRGRTALY